MSIPRAIILTILTFSASFSFAEGVYQAPNISYFKASNVFMRALQMNPGELQISDAKIPRSTKEALAAFKKYCDQNINNYKFAKSVEIKDSEPFKQMNFRCASQDEITGGNQTVQFLASLDDNETLLDLQVLQVESTVLHSKTVSASQSREVMVAVAAGTLASGLLAKGIYPDQNDKVLHAIVGSLVASSTAIFAFYGREINKEKSFWLGVASGVIAGLLKEVYDRYHPDQHTEDRQDAEATALGALTGALVLRFSWEF